MFLGPRKTVVLVGYKTVKEALVNHAEEFGDRDIGPIFRIMNDEHGRILFSASNECTNCKCKTFHKTKMLLKHSDLHGLSGPMKNTLCMTTERNEISFSSTQI